MLNKYIIELRDDDNLRERRVLSFLNDMDAVNHVGQIRYGGEITVWRRGRLITRLPPIRIH